MNGHVPSDCLGLTVFCARAGDHNERAMRGAQALGQALSERLGVAATTIGTPEPVLNAGWEKELAAAKPALRALAAQLDALFDKGLTPLCVLSRCAAALASLPVLMRYHPEACVVWLDAHGDLNTPHTTLSGYLGGMALAGPAGLWDSGLGNGLALDNLILVGVRDLDPAEQALADAGRVRVIPPGDGALAKLQSAIGGRPLYVHIDCDVLEPGIVPTDYRVPGGYSLAELHALFRLLAKEQLIGLELAEFEETWAEGGEAVSPQALLNALDPVIAKLAAGRRPAS